MCFLYPVNLHPFWETEFFKVLNACRYGDFLQVFTVEKSECAQLI